MKLLTLIRELFTPWPRTSDRRQLLRYTIEYKRRNEIMEDM